MHPNLLIVALVLNLAVTLYLKPWVRVANVCRVAGLLVILVAVGHGQTTNQKVAAWEAHAPLGYVCMKDCTVMEAGLAPNIPCLRGNRMDKACQKRSLAAAYQTPFIAGANGTVCDKAARIAHLYGCQRPTAADQMAHVIAGVIRDSDYDEARAIAKANGIDVSKWSYEQVQMQDASDRSRGDDGFLKSMESKPDKLEQYVFKNWYWLLSVIVVGFLFLQFSGGKEANETDINDLDDPDYRTGFVSDYHDDDAFEVPDGMHSQHQIVPVRSRSVSAGR